MGALRKIGYSIRHAPGLSSAEWLWDRLRKPYRRLLNWNGRGAELTLADGFRIRMPPEYTTTHWESYEPESVRAVLAWAKRHPNGLVLDVGSSIGFYSLVSLFSSPQMHVIAFDSDIGSLKATRRMCCYAGDERLSLVYGLLSDRHLSGKDLAGAEAMTESSMRASSSTGDPGTTTYVCLDSNTNTTIPMHSLDGLLDGNPLIQQPVLIKCDVEGAELQVLQGARALLKQPQVELLMSIHPTFLPHYGTSVEQVGRFLEECGYHYQEIAVDSELHWRCEKNYERV